MPYDFRFGDTDQQIALHRDFREATGRKNSITASNFLEFVGNDFPNFTAGQVMEFLWVQTPLRYREIEEPYDDVRQEIVDLIRFTEQKFGVDLSGPAEVAADERRFARRWRELAERPLSSWLEDLRLEVAVGGYSSSIPPADPEDSLARRLVARLVPGPLGLSLWGSMVGPDPVPQAPDGMPECRALNSMAILLDVVGDGVKLTPKGNLRLTDGRAVTDAMGFGDLFDHDIGGKRFKTVSCSEIAPLEMVFRWARAAGIVRVSHGSLLPTARGRRFGKDTEADWRLLFNSAVLKMRWRFATPPRYNFWFWRQDVDEFIPAFLRMAAAAQGRGLALLLVAEACWLMVEDRWEIDAQPGKVLSELRSIANHIDVQLFVPLEWLGAAETWEGAALSSVRLTPAGLAAARRLAIELASDPKTRAPGNVIQLYKNMQ